MLVKESIVERWYQTDSWVYRNFRYLFQNPLWNKDVPRGFSVCPYFWLSLFSMCIFRPLFVLPMRRIILPVLVAIGRPAMATDKALFRCVTRIGLFQRFGSYFTGSGIGLTVVSVVLLVLGCLLLALLYSTIAPVKAFYAYLTSASVLGMFVFWSITSFLTLLGILGLHKAFTDSECKTANYVYLWAALFVAAFAFFLPHETAVGATAVGNAILVALTFVCKGAWFCLKVVGLAVWAFLAWAPIKALYVPWWSYLALLGFVGYFVDRMLTYCDGLKASIAANPGYQDRDRLERNRQNWLWLFLRVLYTCDSTTQNWKSGDVFHEIRAYNLLSENHYWPEACLRHRDIIYRRALEKLFDSSLNTLQGSAPYEAQKKVDWNAIASLYESNMRFDCFYKQTGISLPYHRSGFVTAIMDACREDSIRAQIDETIAELHARELAYKKAKEDQKTSPLHLTCLRVTGAIGSALHRTACGVAWIGTQSCTLAAYLWMLVKAKKQGACPYFRFRDPSQEALDNLNGNDTLGQ